MLPTTCAPVHGVEIDSITMEVRLPPDKLEQIKVTLAQFLGRKKVTLRELQSLIGTLNFACLVVVPGRAFLRRLIDKAKGIRLSFFKIKLSREAKAD